LGGVSHLWFGFEKFPLNQKNLKENESQIFQIEKRCLTPDSKRNKKMALGLSNVIFILNLAMSTFNQYKCKKASLSHEC